MNQTPLNSHFFKRHGRALCIFVLCALFSSIAAIANSTPTVDPPVISSPPVESPPHQTYNTDLKIQSQISQSKILQNSNQELILDIQITTPKSQALQKQRAPVDMVVILDRSSSMSGEQKFPLAKKAISSLMERMNSDDRISLITFSHDGLVRLPLSFANEKCRINMHNVLQSLQPGGSTNMGRGLQLALQQLSQPLKGHSSRVILLSDGQANAGIHDPAGLQNLVKDLTRNDVVVSTIGLGLGFNENVMSSLADHGMGSFSYLEHLAGLDGLFEKDLNDARQQYTNYSQLYFNLPTGIKIIDAGGYPIEQNASSGHASIPLGQLLYSRKKSLMITFSVPTQQLRELQMGTFYLNYKSPEGNMVRLDSGHEMKIAIIEPERKEEVAVTINKDVYQRNWFNNGLGRLKKTISQSLQSGDRSLANKSIREYEEKLQAVQQETGLPLQSAKFDQQLLELKEEVEDSFEGDLHEQKLKQNRYAKKNLEASRSSQRK